MANVQRVIPTPLGHSVAKVVRGSTIFEDAQSCYLTRTPSTAGNKRTSTRSYWIKFTQPDDDYDVTVITGGGSSGNYRYHSGLNSNKTFYRYERLAGSDKVDLNTGSACYRDYGCWYHFVEVIDTPRTTAADRFRFYVNGSRVDLTFNTSYPQNYEGLVNDPTPNRIGARYDASNDELCAQMCEHIFLDGQSLGPEYFGYTDPNTGSWRPKIYSQGVFKEMDKWTCDTYNSWNSGQTALKYQGVKFLTSGGGKVGWRATGSSNTGLNVYTSTDNSTWTRKLSGVTVDSTGLYYESSEQYVIIVNGSDANWSNEQVIISDQNGAKIHYSNGTYPGNGSPTMSWTGPAYSDGTLGSYNSFYLPMDGTGFSAFQTAGNRVQDQSGLQNNHTSSGSPTFQTDSPSGAALSVDNNAGITTTGVPTNYCILNAVSRNEATNNGGVHLTKGNLRWYSDTQWAGIMGTVGANTGKWYYEVTHAGGTAGHDNAVQIGVAQEDHSLANDVPAGGSTINRKGTGWISSTGAINSAGGHDGFGTWGDGDTVGCAFDIDEKKIWFHKNGTWILSRGGTNPASGSIGNPALGTHPIFDPSTESSYAMGSDSGCNVLPMLACQRGKGDVNFGQKPFAYAPPKGFKPWCTANIPQTGVVRPEEYFDAVTWTGDGGTKNITGLKFKPDMTWVKVRDFATTHSMQNSVLGTGLNTTLRPDTSNTLDTNGNLYGYTSLFNDDGFTVVNGSSGGHRVNASGNDYVAWCWKAGGSKGTWNIDGTGYASAAAAGLTNTAAASVNTQSKFGIYKYAGSSSALTLSHGLGVAPNVVIVKSLDKSSESWYVFFDVYDGTWDKMYMNLTNSISDASSEIGSVTSTSFTLQTGNAFNANGYNQIAYAWANNPGVQKFGTYTGNNSTTGPGGFVYTGFRPALVIVKAHNTTGNWVMYDNARGPTNPNPYVLIADANSGGSTNDAWVGSYPLDFLSNGFKLRGNTGEMNGTNSFIYMAWAEAPFQNLYGAQSNAR